MQGQPNEGTKAMRKRTAALALVTVMLTVGATGALAITADQAQSNRPAVPAAHGIHVGELYCADAAQATADPEGCLYMGPARMPIVTHAVPMLYGKGVQ
jgi:hypothetical protein